MARIIWRELKPEAKDGTQVSTPRMEKADRDDKLEVKAERDAWYAAELSLRDGRTFVRFEGYSDDEEEWTQKIKSCKPLPNYIRVVSDQLQDPECKRVSLNKAVCALRRVVDDEGWYDAVVTEIVKRPHDFGDKGEVCTCSFTVVWQDGPGKGTTKADLSCGDICLPSTKDVETHPLIIDILRNVNDEGSKTRRRAADAAVTDYTASVDEGREFRQSKRLKTKASTNDEGSKSGIREADAAATDYTASADEGGEFRQFKRLKTKPSTAATPGHVNGDDFGNPIPLQKAELATNNTDCEAQGKAGKVVGVEGSVSFQNRLKATARYWDRPVEAASSSFHSEGSVRERKGKGDVHHPRRVDAVPLEKSQPVSKANCEGQPHRADAVPKSEMASDRVSEVHAQRENPVSPNADPLQEPISKDKSVRDANANTEESNVHEEYILMKVTYWKVKPPGPTSEIQLDCPDKSHPAPKEEVCVSHKDVEFLGQSVEKVKACDAIKREELLASVSRRLKEPVSHFEEPDSKPDVVPGSSRTNVICLSEDEEDSVSAGRTPFHSFIGSSERKIRRNSTIVRNLLTKAGGSILLIDNLEVGVQPTEVVEFLLQFCDKDEVRLVQIPPPYPHMNHVTGYVVFQDKESADRVAAMLNGCVIVSSSGRPWIVTRVGQADYSSVQFVGDGQDGSRGSTGRFKVVTSKQKSEYSAAKRRKQLFEEHKRQAQIMFRRHAQEEQEVEAELPT